VTDSSCLDFLDKLGIEPPVSDDLILTMAAIFSTNELRNIVLLHSDQTLQVKEEGVGAVGRRRGRTSKRSKRRM